MIVRHRDDIAPVVPSSHWVKILQRAKTSIGNSANLLTSSLRQRPSTITAVFHVSDSWRRVTKLPRCIFLCSLESNTSRRAKTSRRQPTEGAGPSTRSRWIDGRISSGMLQGRLQSSQQGHWMQTAACPYYSRP